jgi:sugar/nucleoside kinase (ribokinase family)
MNILSTGSIYLDINTKLNGVHSSIGPEKEYFSSSYETVLGGSAVIAPLVMAQLGLIPHFVGAVGDDDFGKLVSQKLEHSGIKSHLQTVKGAQTNVGINRIDESGQTYMDVLGNANASLNEKTLSAVVDAEFNNIDVLYVGSIFKTPQLQEILIKTADRFRAAGKLVFLDHGRVPSSLKREEVSEVLDKVMPHVSHYAPSEQDIQSAWNLASADELVELLVKKYPAVITHIKMGEHGSLVIADSHVTNIAPHGKIDSGANPNFVGAGDSSNAGFIYGLSQRMSPTESGKIANHVAYLHITGQTISAEAIA